MFASRRFIHLPRRLSVNLRPTLVNLRPTLRVASQALREFSAASSSGGDKKNLKLADISIDTSGLVQRPVLDESSTVLNESNTNDVDCTAMESELIKLITLRGPITIAEYMRQVLTHPKFGYYSTQEKEDTKIFGAGGSFTTSPEISQLFGESIAVFILNQWELCGKPDKVDVVELGPGRGTLIRDALKVWKNDTFAQFYQSIKSVNLIERSAQLRDKQCDTLGAERDDSSYQMAETKSANGNDVAVESEEEIMKREMEDAKLMLGARLDNDLGVVKKPLDADSHPDLEQTVPQSASTATSSVDFLTSAKLDSKIPVRWHHTFPEMESSFPTDHTTFVICQELLDALPIHVFEYTKKGWREKLVDINDSKDGLSIVLSKGVTVACRGLLGEWIEEDGKKSKKKNSPEVGTVVEVSPESLTVSLDIATRINRNGGAAVIVDYGSANYCGGETLRGFLSHNEVSILERPGETDVTGDVDFRRIVETIGREKALDSVTVDPVCKQGEWLMRMGIGERASLLIEDDNVSEEQANDIYSGFERLVGGSEVENGMGEVYKVLTLRGRTLRGRNSEK